MSECLEPPRASAGGSLRRRLNAGDGQGRRAVWPREWQLRIVRRAGVTVNRQRLPVRVHERELERAAPRCLRRAAHQRDQLVGHRLLRLGRDYRRLVRLIADRFVVPHGGNVGLKFRCQHRGGHRRGSNWRSRRLRRCHRASASDDHPRRPAGATAHHEEIDIGALEQGLHRLERGQRRLRHRHAARTRFGLHFHVERRRARELVEKCREGYIPSLDLDETVFSRRHMLGRHRPWSGQAGSREEHDGYESHSWCCGDGTVYDQNNSRHGFPHLIHDGRIIGRARLANKRSTKHCVLRD